MSLWLQLRPEYSRYHSYSLHLKNFLELQHERKIVHIYIWAIVLLRSKIAGSQGNIRIIKRDTTYEGQSNRIGLCALAEDLRACSVLERRRLGEGCDSQKRKTQRKNCQQGFRGEHFLCCEVFGEGPRESTLRWQEKDLDWLPFNGLCNGIQETIGSACILAF
jgi:hypothetical protein